MRSTTCLGRACAFICLCGLTGCVPLAPYLETKDEVARLRDINQAQERALKQVELRMKTIESREASGQIKEATYQETLDQLEQDKLNLMAKLDEARRKLVELQAAPPTIRTLTRDLDGVEEPEPGRLVLKGEFFFPSGSAKLRREALASLNQLAGEIRRAFRGHRIYIDGHTDRQPVKVTLEENRDNWLLGAKRAHAVFEYFTRNGFESPGDRERFVLRSFGFGDERERGRLNSPENRRVEIRIGEALEETERRGS